MMNQRACSTHVFPDGPHPHVKAPPVHSHPTAQSKTQPHHRMHTTDQGRRLTTRRVTHPPLRTHTCCTSAQPTCTHKKRHETRNSPVQGATDTVCTEILTACCTRPHITTTQETPAPRTCVTPQGSSRPRAPPGPHPHDMHCMCSVGSRCCSSGTCCALLGSSHRHMPAHRSASPHMGRQPTGTCPAAERASFI